MQSHIRLGRIVGIKIGLHYSWLLIALLIRNILQYLQTRMELNMQTISL